VITEDGKDDYDELERLRREVKNGETALRIACESIASANDRVALLTKTLESALALTDAMMTEMRRLPTPPAVTVIVAKANFDKVMKKLLGGERKKEP